MSTELAGLGSIPSAATMHVYDHVYRLIRHALIIGDLAPGARLVEADLAGHLGVSRTPVRDALRRLESDGLVRRTSKGGLEAATLSHDSIDAIFLVRVELDGLAARLASGRGSEAVWAGLRDQAARLGPLAEAHGTASYEFTEAHEAVHSALYAIAFTQPVAAMLGDRLLALGRIGGQLSYAEDRPGEPAAEQHLALIDALASHNEATAVAAAREHVRQAWSDARASYIRQR